MARCALCKQAVDTDSAFVLYGRNPETFRNAWMHDQCAIAALESLHSLPSKDTRYSDRHDEYISRFEN
jgi:hypothetical protein